MAAIAQQCCTSFSLRRKAATDNMLQIIKGGRWKRKYWKTQVRKRQVRNSEFRKDGKRMYGKRKYGSAGMENASTENASTMQTSSEIKKSLVLHKLVWCIFKWGGQVDYRLFFFWDNVNNQK